MRAVDDVAHIIRWVFGERNPTVELVCAEHPDPRRGIAGAFVVQLSTCVSELKLADYLQLAGAGIRVRVRTDGCSDVARVEEGVRAARRLIALTGTSMSGPIAASGEGRSKRDVHQLRGLPFSRRQMLGLGGGRRPELPAAGATDREREVFALQQLCNGTIPEALTLEPVRSARVVADGCTGCGVCVRACPENAMQLTRTEDAFTLQKHHRTCTDCGECIRLCPEKALTHDGQMTWGAVLADAVSIVAIGESRLCARCGAGFQPQGDEEYCPTCAFRVANPFGMAAPPKK